MKRVWWHSGLLAAGLGAVVRLTGRLGLQLDGLARLFVVSGRAVVAPGGAVAVVLLPR